ncbi:MAG: hypothetical protein QM811_16275 [Pirellulales bacterium]
MNELLDISTTREFGVTHAGVVFALPIEAGPFEDRLSDKTTMHGDRWTAVLGRIGNRRVVSWRAGVGSENARRGCEALLAGHRPAWTISAGFSGGLDPRLKIGDLVWAERTLSPDGRHAIPDLADVTLAGLSSSVTRATIVQRESIIRLPADKAALFQETAAAAVDMESWSVCEACVAAGRRFLALRVISDTAGEELPIDVEALIAPQTTAQRAGKILGGIFRRPGLVKDLWTLQTNASLASQRLGEALVALIAKLP